MSEPPAAGLRRRLDRHPGATDAVLAAVVLAASLLGLPPTPAAGGDPQVGPLTPGAVGALVLAGGALAFRRRHPVIVWAGVTALVVGVVPAFGAQGRGLPMVVVALYTVAAHTDRRTSLATAVTTAVAAFVLVTTEFDVGAADPLTYAAAAWTLLPAAVGDAVRSGRQVVAAAVERAERAEATREEEARRRVAEERLRIGRELHDVVAHHVATITVHAGVAEHLLATDPAQAATSLRHVRESSTRALEEMHSLVAVLRGAGDDADDRDLDPPAPTLDDLDDLVERVRASGAGVRHTRRGRCPPCPSSPDCTCTASSRRRSPTRRGTARAVSPWRPAPTARPCGSSSATTSPRGDPPAPGGTGWSA